MSTSKERRKRRVGQRGPVGLTALGLSGPWEVAIDETTSGPDRWFARIEGPATYLYFEIASPRLIEQALQFFDFRGTVSENAAAETGLRTLALGMSRSVKVSVTQDDEFSDRYFLTVEAAHGPLVRFTIAGDDLTHLVAALRECQDDLE